MKRFSKPLLMLAAVFCLVGFANVQSAFADPVVFSTTGVFTGTSGGGVTVVGSGTNTITFTDGTGTTTLTFVGTSGAGNTPFGAQFGDIQVTSTSTTGVPLNGTFTLTFTQTVPGPTGSDTAAATVSGTLGLNTGIATLNFTGDNTAFINGITYTLNPMYTLPVPVTGAGGGAVAGNLTIQGTVTGSAIPEPATMVLLGTGLAGLAAKVRRRRKNTEA